MKDLRFENRVKRVAFFLKRLHDHTIKTSNNIEVFKIAGQEAQIASMGAMRSLLVNDLKIISLVKNNKKNVIEITWIGPEPNIKLATSVTNAFTALLKSYNKKYNSVTKPKVEPLSEQPRTTDTEIKEIKEITRIETVVEKGGRSDKEFRVHMFMQFLYEKIRDLMLSDTNLELSEKLKHFSLEPEIMDVLVANKFVMRDRSKSETVFIWNVSEPTEEMVKKVTDELVSFINISNIRSSFCVPVKNKSFNSDEVKVINVLKNNGRKFAEIADLIERSEIEVKNMYYEYIIKVNS